MAKFKNRVIASFLVVSMLVGTVSSLAVTENTKVVYAESKSVQSAKKKVNQLVNSIKSNYLGIKNRETWEKYIDECFQLIDKIPNSESEKADELYQQLWDCIDVVQSAIVINQVEKSMLPKEQGGLGNYLGIKNAQIWRLYLSDVEDNLYFFNKEVFKKQYDELEARYEKVSEDLKIIEDKFKIEYHSVLRLFEEAKISDNKEKIQEVLEKANKLETSSEKDSLIFNIKRYVEGKSSIDFLSYTNDRYSYTIDYPGSLKKLKNESHSGATFVSGDVMLFVNGTRNYRADTALSYYNRYLKKEVEGKVITNNITEDTIELTYIKNGTVKHIKGTIGVFSANIMEFSYPESKAEEYNDIAEHIKSTFVAPFSDDELFYDDARE